VAENDTPADIGGSKPTGTVEDSRERLAQPYGITKPVKKDPATARREALRGTVPDVLDPNLPNVTTGDRVLLADKPGATPVNAIQRAERDAAAAAARNRGETVSDDAEVQDAGDEAEKS
jgi:hypothetical protein